MRVDQKKKKCNESYLRWRMARTRLETPLFSTLRNFHRQESSSFLFSPLRDNSTVRFAYLHPRRSSKYFHRDFLSNFANRYLDSDSARFPSSIKHDWSKLVCLIGEAAICENASNEILSRGKCRKRRCYYAGKLWNVDSLEEVGARGNNDRKLAVSFEWRTMCNWEGQVIGQGALLYRGKRWIGSRESSLPEYKRAPLVSRTCVSKFQIKSADSPLFLPNDSCNYYYYYYKGEGKKLVSPRVWHGSSIEIDDSYSVQF